MFQGQTLYPEDVPRGRAVPSQFRRQMVRYQSGEQPGTMIIDARAHYLYFVLGGGQAIRYGVGRTGFGWKGTVRIGGKQEWPTWHPPKEMRAREAKRGPEAAINVFNVHAEEQGETRAPRTWFVIAGSLFEAMSLIPEGLSVKAVEVWVGTVAGPGRVIRSMGASTVH